jgi:hypothetical protein
MGEAFLRALGVSVVKAMPRAVFSRSTRETAILRRQPGKKWRFCAYWSTLYPLPGIHAFLLRGLPARDRGRSRFYFIYSVGNHYGRDVVSKYVFG